MKDVIVICDEFECLECHRRLSIEEAETAMEEGCPGRGGSDIDIAS